MTATDLTLQGTMTLQSRVERWESDYNRHWNVRFFARSFQAAAEVAAARATGSNPGAATTGTRHIRFHRELFTNAPVTIRSSRVAAGVFAGAILHVLSSAGWVAATALDMPSLGATSLPALPSTLLDMALPRGIPGGAHPEVTARLDQDRVVEMGPVRPDELDHAGGFLAEHILRLAALASHDHLSELGFTPDFVTRSGISRMSVEIKTTRHADPVAGNLVQARSRLLEVGRKKFAVMHWIETAEGAPLASVEQCLVAVDLASRKAVEVPDFMRLAKTMA